MIYYYLADDEYTRTHGLVSMMMVMIIGGCARPVLAIRLYHFCLFGNGS